MITDNICETIAIVEYTSDVVIKPSVISLSRAAKRGGKLTQAPNSKGSPKLEEFSMGWF